MKRRLPVSLVIVTAILFTLNLVYHFTIKDVSNLNVEIYEDETEKSNHTLNLNGIQFLDEHDPKQKNTTTPEKAILPAQAETPLSFDTVEINPKIIESFTTAIIEGESRTPPIVRREAEEVPSQSVLNDPDQYLKFQSKQRQKLFVSYAKAAKPKIDKLKRLVAEGEAGGISEEKLQEGRMKIQKLEEMLEQLKQENPEIIELIKEESQRLH